MRNAWFWFGSARRGVVWLGGSDARLLLGLGTGAEHLLALAAHNNPTYEIQGAGPDYNI